MTRNCIDCTHFTKMPVFELDAETHAKKQVGIVDACSGNGPAIGLVDISDRRQACALFKDKYGNEVKKTTDLQVQFNKDKNSYLQDDVIDAVVKEDYTSLTNAQLKEQLDAKGIKYTAKATKAKLIELLESA